MESSIIKVGGMSCQGCVKNIGGVLSAMPGVASAEVSLEAGEARVAFDPQVVTRSALVAAIEDAGFEMRDSIGFACDASPEVRAFVDSLSDAQLAAFARIVDLFGFGGILAWVFGSGFPKSHDVSKGIDRHLDAEREVVATERVRDIRNGLQAAGVPAAGSKP